MNREQLKKLERDLWAAAAKLRANSDLKASEYSTPVLGLIIEPHGGKVYAIAAIGPGKAHREQPEAALRGAREGPQDRARFGSPPVSLGSRHHQTTSFNPQEET